jgi:hypothetical protein
MEINKAQKESGKPERNPLTIQEIKKVSGKFYKL